MHSSKVYFGSAQSNSIEVESFAGSVAAGLAVYLHADGSINTTAASGVLIGISLGADLSDTAYTAVCRKGLGIPIKLESGFTTPAVGTAVQISTTTGMAKASGTTVNAIYRTEELDAVNEDGSVYSDKACVIDFPGGL